MKLTSDWLLHVKINTYIQFNVSTRYWREKKTIDREKKHAKRFEHLKIGDRFLSKTITRL